MIRLKEMLQEIVQQLRPNTVAWTLKVALRKTSFLQVSCTLSQMELPARLGFPEAFLDPLSKRHVPDHCWKSLRMLTSSLIFAHHTKIPQRIEQRFPILTDPVFRCKFKMNHKGPSKRRKRAPNMGLPGANSGPFPPKKEAPSGFRKRPPKPSASRTRCTCQAGTFANGQRGCFTAVLITRTFSDEALIRDINPSNWICPCALRRGGEEKLQCAWTLHPTWSNVQSLISRVHIDSARGLQTSAKP